MKLEVQLELGDDVVRGLKEYAEAQTRGSIPRFIEMYLTRLERMDDDGRSYNTEGGLELGGSQARNKKIA